MKKLIFMGVLGLFLLGSCNSKSEHDHEGHSHETEKYIIMIMKAMITSMRNTIMRVKTTKDITTRQRWQPDIPMR